MTKELIIKNKIASKKSIIISSILLSVCNGFFILCVDYINQLHIFSILMLDLVSIMIFVKHHREWHKYRFSSNGLYQETYHWVNKVPHNSRLLFYWKDVKRIETSSGQLTSIDSPYLFITIQCRNPQKGIVLDMAKFEGINKKVVYNCNREILDFLKQKKKEMPYIYLCSK